jgi:hypothetical protein
MGRETTGSISVEPHRPVEESTVAASDDGAPVGWWKSRLVAALVMPVALFIVLRPEPYGIAPNGLDPFFYSGYAMNFGDILREIGGSSYFVTRWTAYMPGRFFSWMFGAFQGRLILRSIVASAMLISIWHLGRRWRWTRSTEVVVGVVVLTSPIFARAFLTDYVEWFVVAGGIVLICQCLEPTARPLRAATIGALVAAIAIANPAAVFVALAPCIAYLVHLGASYRTRLLHAAIGLAAAVGIVVFGLLLFRLAYDIPNVYRPTIDFLRTRSGQRDLLKSPRLTWMGAFTWIYSPVILLVSVFAVPPLRRAVRRLDRGYTVLVLLAVQYTLQWIDQFVRDGNGLEVPYYWSFVYPSLAIAMAMVIGLAGWKPISASLFVAVWWAVLAMAHVDSLRLPAGWMFALLTVVVIAVLALIPGLGSRAVLGIGAVALFILTTQAMSPNYDPTAYHIYNLDPQYDEIFYNSDSIATQMFEEAIWLERELDELPDDSGMYFFGAGNGPAIIGIYGVHVTGRWIVPDETGRFPQAQVDAAAAGLLGRIVLYGQTDIVDEAITQLTSAGGRLIMNQADPIVDGYELAVVDMPDGS